MGDDGALRGDLAVNDGLTVVEPAARVTVPASSLMHGILDASPDGLVMAAPDGAILAANGRAEELFGYAAGELVGRQVESLVPARVRAHHPGLREGYLADGRSRPMGVGLHLYGVRRDGTEFPVDIALSTVDADGGRVALAAVRDVSDRMALVSELREARDVAEAARLMADSANNAKSEFLSRMSHELRTPLNAILGFAQLLEMDELDPEQLESVHHIRRAGDHLLQLINEVLDISRVEAGHLALSLEPVSVGHAVRESLDLVRPQAAAREITLTHPPLEGSPFVVADAQRLKQVLVNLLSNAVKYNRHAGRVDLSWRREDGRVEIGVTDTGPGIPVKLHPRVFSAFDRLGAEQSGVPGSGVGLALSQRLTGAMDGRLSLVASDSPGATFVVDLPAADVDDGPDGGSPGRHVDLHDVVLYVEDNLSNLRLVERVVSRRPGWRLVHALHGELGIELARAQRPALVLLDLHLPDMSGEIVLSALKARPETRDVPVWFLTADATPGQADRLQAAGAAGVLTKPVDVRELLGLLDVLAEPTPP